MNWLAFADTMTINTWFTIVVCLNGAFVLLVVIFLIANFFNKNSIPKTGSALLSFRISNRRHIQRKIIDHRSRCWDIVRYHEQELKHEPEDSGWRLAQIRTIKNEIEVLDALDLLLNKPV